MVVLCSSLPPATVEVERWLVNDYTELRPLRESLRQTLQAQPVLSHSDSRDVIERITIVATELATNALLHAQSPTVVRLNRSAAAFILDVADDQPTSPPHIAEDRLPGAGGLGLRVTQELASDAGWYVHEQTKRVWAQFPIPRRSVLPTPRIAVPGLGRLLRCLRRLNNLTLRV